MSQSRLTREKQMIKILLVSSEKDSLSDLASTLEKQNDADISRTETGGKALDMVLDGFFDLVVTDEMLKDMAGLKFAEKLVAVNPMINCAAVSPLSSKEFHEASEGLGLLMQLPVRPGKEHAKDLLERLRKILNLTADKMNS